MNDIYKDRFEYLASKHWVEEESKFRFGLEVSGNLGDEDKYLELLISAIDSYLV